MMYRGLKWIEENPGQFVCVVIGAVWAVGMLWGRL